ncbi:MAG TPA: protoheme IX farnesyltransferase, partial [Anaeromyxobacter sp.]
MSTATAPLRAAASPVAYARDLVLLSKPRLSGLVLLTCAGGLALAPGEIGLEG